MTPLLLLSFLAQTPEPVTAVDAGVPSIELPTLIPVIDAIGAFEARSPTDSAAWNAFEVPRVHLGLGAEWHGVEAKVLVEGVYATQGGALTGVAGDSLVARLREAWAGYRWNFLEARLGLVPTLMIPEQEKAWRFRSLAPDALEAFGLASPADFGATLSATLPRGYGLVAVAVTNGEGYASRELNPNKNVEVLAVVHPLPTLVEPLAVHGVAMVGSQGLPAATTNRFGGGVVWVGDALGAGVDAYAVQGLLSDGGRKGTMVQAFARGTLFEHLLLAGRVAWLSRDSTRDDTQLDVLGAVGFGLGPLESFVAVGHTFLSGAAKGALPGVEGTDVRVVARFKWSAVVPLSMHGSVP